MLRFILIKAAFYFLILEVRKLSAEEAVRDGTTSRLGIFENVPENSLATQESVTKRLLTSNSTEGRYGSEIDYSMVNFSTKTPSSQRNPIDYSLINTTDSMMSPTAPPSATEIQTTVIDQTLPEIKLYLEVDYLDSEPRMSSLESFFEKFISELLDMSDMEQKFTFSPSPISVETVHLVPVTLFPIHTSGMVPIELSVHSEARIYQNGLVDNDANDSFFEQAEDDLSHSLLVYLTLWDCSEFMGILADDCGLRSPKLVAIYVGNTEVARFEADEGPIISKNAVESYPGDVSRANALSFRKMIWIPIFIAGFAAWLQHC